MRAVLLLLFFLHASHAAPKKCAIIQGDISIDKEAVFFLLKNECPNEGLRLDFSPDFDGPCAYNTCFGHSNLSWKKLANNVISANFSDLSTQCPGTGAHLYAVPVDCKNGGRQTRATETITIRKDYSEGFSIEPSRYWWNPDGEDSVLLEMEIATWENSNRVVAISASDKSDVRVTALSECNKNSATGACIQYVYVAAYAATSSRTVQMYVHFASGKRKSFSLVLDLSHKGELTEWQQKQTLDAMLFTDASLEVPYLNNDVLKDGDLLCVSAIAPGASSMRLQSARICSGDKITSCQGTSVIELDGAVQYGKRDAVFCFVVEKYSESDRQILEVTYDVEASLQKRGDYDNRNRCDDDDCDDCCTKRFVCKVECDHGSQWDGQGCGYKSYMGWWKGGSHSSGWAWIFFVFVMLILLCLCCFVCASSGIDALGMGYTTANATASATCNTTNQKGVYSIKKEDPEGHSHRRHHHHHHHRPPF